MTDQESLRANKDKLWAEIANIQNRQYDKQITIAEAIDQILTLITHSNKALLDRIRSGLPERKILPTVQEQYAHPIIRMKEAEQAEFNRALDQVAALLDKEESDL